MTADEIRLGAERLLPTHMSEGVMRYIERGVPMGNFGTALLSNDFMGAHRRADVENLLAMHSWAIFLESYAPRGCYGSPSAVKSWCASGGLSGLDMQDAV